MKFLLGQVLLLNIREEIMKLGKLGTYCNQMLGSGLLTASCDSVIFYGAVQTTGWSAGQAHIGLVLEKQKNNVVL